MRASLALVLSCLSALAAQSRTPLRQGWTFAVGPATARPADDQFRPIAVPGTFEDHLGATFDGAGWYRLQVPRQGHGQARARLEFHGAATLAQVFVDGTEVGRHLGAWTPFRVELPAADRGESLVEVWLDEKVGHNTQGFHPIIQPHFGGLWQDVVLCVDAAPSIDRFSLLTFGDGASDELQVELRALPGPEVTAPLRARVTLSDGATEVGRGEAALVDGQTRLRVRVAAPRPWSPHAPHLYRAVVELLAGDAPCDRVERRVGFRDLRADGTRLLLDGAPLSVRGMLHWGYEPPRLAPNLDAAHWRREMEDLRARGFNMVKACLWLPPSSFFEIADEVGMLIWQEYPTWHPTLTPEHRDALLVEFGEFFLHERSHVSVPFRSLTCETGHSADLGVIRALYDRAKATIPQALVVDDSSWIEWLRVYDFFDDHPYGNNSWWPGKLDAFKKFIAAREPKPLLLGECIAADTWLDLPAWQSAWQAAQPPTAGAPKPWFAPRCVDDQPRFEAWVRAQFGEATLAQLRPDSLAYAMRMRKYQIEELRLRIPDAGYTVSVLRDFTLARMGLYDDLGAMKWPAEAWAWHGDTMLCLDTPEHRRAFAVGEVRLPVRAAHAGRGDLQGQLRVWIEGEGEQVTADVAVAAGTVSAPVVLDAKVAAVDVPRRVRVRAALTGSHTATNTWDVWVLPARAPQPPGAVRVVDTLDAATLQFLRQGGRVLHRAGDRQRSLKTQSMWFLRGSCFAPPHPLHARVPAEFLQELQTFDLEVGRVMPWQNLLDQVDPILAFWETHDISEVRAHLFAFDCRVEQGRLAVSALDHTSAAGRFVEAELIAHLQRGPAPQRALSAATVAALAGFLGNGVLPLDSFELRTDPRDEGLARGFAAGYPAAGNQIPADGWRKVHTKAHWESQGVEHYDGVAWYRAQVDVPADWRGQPITAVFEGVDDSFRLYVNGAEVARFGDPEKDVTVWLQRVTADLGPHLRSGQRNVLVLRVVDHRGAGGVYKPVFLTTGPADAKSDLLH